MSIIATFFSSQDMLLIFLIVLLLFGAKKLPELAKGLGQAVREFTRAKDEIERELIKPVTEVKVQPVADQQAHNPAVPTTTAVSTPATPPQPAPPTPPSNPTA